MADKTDGIQSPDALEIKGKGAGGLRIGKKAAAMVVAILAVAALIVGFNIATRKPASLDKKAVGDNQADSKLTPATSAGKEMTQGVSDGAASSWQKGAMTGNTLAPIPGNGFAPAAGTSVPNLGPAPGAGAPNGQPNANMAANLGPNGTSTPPLSEAEQSAQKLKQQREQERTRAVMADSAVEKFQATEKQPAQQQNGSAAALAAQLKGLQIGGGGAPGLPGGGAPNNEEPDQNRQAQKQAFLDRAAALPDTPYLASVRKAPLSQYELKTGTIIPAIMIDGVNSDLPGDINAQVSENVFDSATGQFLLIPQGTRLFGSYDSAVAYGQDGLLVVWKRLIFPDGSTQELGGMGGADQGGYSGFRDKVDNHYGRLIGFGVATSLFSAAFQLSQPQQNGTAGQQLSSQQTVAAAVGTQMSQLGIEITRRNLRIQPTIEIRNGYRFVVKINKDMVFPSVYR